MLGALGCPAGAPAPGPDAGAAAPVTEPDADPEIRELPRAAAPVAPPARDTGDLAAITKRGALRVLVYGAEESLLPRAGRSTQLDRALAEDLAARLGVRADIVYVPRFDDLIPALESGVGDLIAARLAVTKERKQRIAFSRPTTTVKELLVGREGADVPARVEQLAGRTVTVRKSSAYRESLDALKEKVPTLSVADAPEDQDTPALLRAVARGDLELTVADHDLLEEVRAFEPALAAGVAVREGRDIAWGLRKENPALKAAADAFLVEAALHAHALEASTGDLDVIKRRGSIRMLTRNNPASYFLAKGTQQGFDYELVRLFAKQHGLRVDVIVPPDSADLIPWLLEGRGDVIAAQMPITEARALKLRFSQRVHTVDAQLVELVLDPTLVSDADIGKDTAYATRKDNPALADALDAFLKASDRGLEWNVLKKRYFTPRTSTEAAAPGPASGGGAISPYDALIHAHASRYGFDWRLMLAQAYQESRFDPKARSWVGAQGLFQVMPATGKEMGFLNLEDPDEGVQAGVRYMAQLVDSFDPAIPFKHRVRFALASYNAGRGHVEDARVLAREMGLDPNKWFKHVEKAMLRLQDPKVARRARHGWCRAEEPVKYVSEIQSRYDNYLTLLPDAPAAATKD